MFNNLLNILFPESCPMCDKPSSEHKTAPFCSECWQTIVPYKGPGCRICSKPLASDASTVCGECMKDEPAFSSVMIFGLYRGALRKAINLLKYHNVKRLSKPLADILLNINTPAIDGILPVPLHRKRLRHREFNQSALLARYVAHNLGVPLIIDCLIKMTDTLPQVGLTSKERKENISNAFGIQDNTLVKGKNIMLIDDVITTGATVRECSKILKKAGAHDIHVVALAHGIRD